jgi:eukaryotic-like serine/threonine-protein kinase
MEGKPPPEHDKPFEEMETLDRAEGHTRSSPTPRMSGTHPAAGPALTAGRIFGPYRLVSVLGRGGFGQVWEAESLETGRRVALKVLHAPDLTPEVHQRFEREGQVAASLNHPNCVFVLGAETIEGWPSIAMELMPGGTLGDVLKRRGALPPAEAVDHALQILDGLEAAHAAGFLHRDLKPSNCFLDGKGVTKIGDFGLSRLVTSDSDLTATGSFLGTPSYASPEQVRGRDVDLRSDLYSFGATLYALLAGAPPFEGKRSMEVLSRILTEDPAPLSRLGRDIPRGLQAIVLRLLAKDPARRWRDHTSLRAALIPYSSKGLTAGSLPRRAAAFLADLVPFWILEALLGAAVLRGEAGLPALALVKVASFVAQGLYFFACEGLWGRTPGKALLGLRVTSVVGAALGWRQVAVRTAVFMTLFRLEDLVGLARRVAAFQAPATVAVILGAASVVAQIAILATMRRRNGFAGLHELVSGTRVRFVRSRPPAFVVPAAAALPAQAASPRTFGPYGEAGQAWRTDGAEVLLARDPGLDRPVWVQTFADPGRVRPLADVAAPASSSGLRWLQGSRETGALWDAYEHPGGIGLVEWVERTGGLSWTEMRNVLLGVARALADDLGPRLSLSRIWIDAAGRVRLLPFSLGPETGEAPSWGAFLRRLVLFGLEGRAPDADEGPRMPRANVPEHARPVLQRLCGAGPPFDGPAAVKEAVEDLVARPARVTRGLRAASLVLPLSPLLLVGAVVTIVLLVIRGMIPGFQDLSEMNAHVKLARELETSQEPGAPEKRRAVRVLLASAYAALDRLAAGEDVLSSVPPETRALLEAAHREHPQPDAAQLAEARRILGLPEKASVRSGGTSLSIQWTDSGESPVVEVMRGVFTYLGWLGVIAVVLSPWLRAGPALHLLGLTLQRADGARVGRGRAVLRAALAWAPFFVALGLDTAEFRWTPLSPAGLLIVSTAVVGVAWAVLHPDRGVADLLARTRLVPR